MVTGQNEVGNGHHRLTGWKMSPRGDDGSLWVRFGVFYFCSPPPPPALNLGCHSGVDRKREEPFSWHLYWNFSLWVRLWRLTGCWAASRKRSGLSEQGSSLCKAWEINSLGELNVTQSLVQPLHPRLTGEWLNSSEVHFPLLKSEGRT